MSLINILSTNNFITNIINIRNTNQAEQTKTYTSINKMSIESKNLFMSFEHSYLSLLNNSNFKINETGKNQIFPFFEIGNNNLPHTKPNILIFPLFEIKTNFNEEIDPTISEILDFNYGKNYVIDNNNTYFNIDKIIPTLINSIKIINKEKKIIISQEKQKKEENENAEKTIKEIENLKKKIDEVVEEIEVEAREQRKTTIQSERSRAYIKKYIAEYQMKKEDIKQFYNKVCKEYKKYIEANQAQEAANQAQEAANQEYEAANKAQEAANKAEKAANKAQEAANKAEKAANKAIKAIRLAIILAIEALSQTKSNETTNQLNESLQLTNSEISNSYFLMIKDPKTNKLTLYCLIEFKEEVIFKTLSIHKDNKLYFQKNDKKEVEIHEIEINIPLIGLENKKLDIEKYNTTNNNKYERNKEGFKTIANINYNDEEYDIYFPSFFKKTNSLLKIKNLIVTLTPNNNNSEYEVEKSYSFTKETENDNINQQEVINETCQLIAKNRIFGNTILKAKTKEERKDL